MTRLYRHYDSTVAGERFDAIIIGSGMGGLSTAAILSRQGRKVLVLERDRVPGGLTHPFRRHDFEFDVGLHYLGALHDETLPLRCVFDYITDGAQGWAEIAPVYDRLCFDDQSYDLAAGVDAFQDMLARSFPGERRAIAAYLELVQKVDRLALRFYALHCLPGWLARVTDPMLGRPFRGLARRTTAEVLRSLGASPRLSGVLTAQWGNCGLPPAQCSFAMHALMVAYYLHGASYPVGGSGSLWRHIAPVIQRAGGEIRTHAEVQEILVRDGRAVGVRLAGGDEIRARTILSSAGAVHTLGTLLPARWRPPRIEKGLRTLGLSPGHICLYLGLRGSAKELGLVAQPNLWVHASYDHDASVQAWLRDPEARPAAVFMDSASARDPAWKHPHLSTFTVTTLVPYEWFAPWAHTRWRRRGQDYEAFKARLAERLLDMACAHVPAIRGRIAHKELSTPLSTEHFCNHPGGAAYGLEHTPARFAQRWLRPGLPIRNLFLVGQDVVSVGVGAAAMSGVIAASALLGKNVLGEIVRSAAKERRYA